MLKQPHLDLPIMSSAFQKWSAILKATSKNSLHNSKSIEYAMLPTIRNIHMNFAPVPEAEVARLRNEVAQLQQNQQLLEEENRQLKEQLDASRRSHGSDQQLLLLLQNESITDRKNAIAAKDDAEAARIQTEFAVADRAELQERLIEMEKQYAMLKKE